MTYILQKSLKGEEMSLCFCRYFTWLENNSVYCTVTVTQKQHVPVDNQCVMMCCMFFLRFPSCIYLSHTEQYVDFISLSKMSHFVSLFSAPQCSSVKRFQFYGETYQINCLWKIYLGCSNKWRQYTLHLSQLYMIVHENCTHLTLVKLYPNN